MKTINGLEELRSLIGEEVAVSKWFKVYQASIDEFADEVESRDVVYDGPVVSVASWQWSGSTK
jgi:hypothetical protein